MTTPTPPGSSTRLERVGDLGRQPLLHLQPAGEHVDDPRDLAETEDAAVGEIRDVRLAEEGQQVVLAEAVDLDVPHHDHLRVRLLEDGAVDELVELLVVAAEEIAKAPGARAAACAGARSRSGSSPTSARSEWTSGSSGSEPACMRGHAAIMTGARPRGAGGAPLCSARFRADATRSAGARSKQRRKRPRKPSSNGLSTIPRPRAGGGGHERVRARINPVQRTPAGPQHPPDHDVVDVHVSARHRVLHAARDAGSRSAATPRERRPGPPIGGPGWRLRTSSPRPSASRCWPRAPSRSTSPTSSQSFGCRSRIKVSAAELDCRSETVIDTFPKSASTPPIDENALSPSPLIGVSRAPHCLVGIDVALIRRRHQCQDAHGESGRPVGARVVARVDLVAERVLLLGDGERFGR